MKESIEEKIKRLTFARDCIDTSYDAGLQSYISLDKTIQELTSKLQKENKN